MPISGKGCDITGFKDRIRKAGNNFILSKEVKQNQDILDPSGFVKEVFDSVFHLPFEYRNVIAFEPGQVRTFENRLSEIRRSIQKGEINGRFGEFLYNTSARAKKNPYANSLLNDLIDVNYNYKGLRDRHMQQFTRIKENGNDKR